MASSSALDSSADDSFGLEDLVDDDRSQAFISYDSVEIVCDADGNVERLRFTYGVWDVHTISSELVLSNTASLQLPVCASIEELQCAAFNVGMCALAWVYMGFCYPRIIVRAGYFSQEQVEFWQNLYRAALAEFFMENRLDYNELVLIEVDCLPGNKDSVLVRDKTRAKQPNVLVPLGAGKDSLTVYELIRKYAPEVATTWMFMGDHNGEFEECWRYDAVARASRSPTVIVVANHMPADEEDKFEAARNQTLSIVCPPWAAQVAFVSTFVSAMYGFNYIAVGNERSANEGNGTVYLGAEVNHQYDKSFAWEKQCHEYIRRWIVSDVHYFSALQHLWEVQIAHEFCRHPQYLPLFISCNSIDESRWCARCAKCAFVFLLLSAFLTPEQAWSVFGDNLFESKLLQETFAELLGMRASKPLECVGTAVESRAALRLAFEQYNHRCAGDTSRLPLLLRETVDLKQLPSLAECTELLHDHFEGETLIPQWFQGVLNYAGTITLPQEAAGAVPPTPPL